MTGTETTELRPPPTASGLAQPCQESPSTGCFASTKIQRHHLQRQAFVYVRQSSPQQVRNNKESRERQYALVHRARALGWSETQIEVLDDDQGHSGRTMEGRLGFQRLLAEVSLDHVGIILGLEMNRLARSCKDWHQLLELCALFHTLLADQDGLYDPRDHNDRLLLGLTGIMSEAELHVLRRRMHEGKLNKARRGELFTRVPVGYVIATTGEATLDPDEQVRAVVRLVFEKFEELGSASAVLRYLVANRIRLPARAWWGPDRGELRWRKPRQASILAILHNPTYAGVYAYGPRSAGYRGPSPKRSARTRPSTDPRDWEVFLPDRLPAYISWDQYLAHQRQLEQNRSRMASLGAAREGLPLLSGLLVCGRCGARMLVAFRNRTLYRYVCCQRQLCYADARCQTFAGRALDRLIGEKVLTVLAPAALELSLHAVEDVQRERERLAAHWQHQLERARYEANRAYRQYDATEPENRLVVRALEQRWEEALREQQRLEAEYQQFLEAQPTRVTEEETGLIRSLSTSIPDLWNDPQTSPAERKTIVRHLIERVVVAVQADTEFVDVAIHWVGGFVSKHELRRPVLKYEQLRDFKQLKERIEALADAGRSPADIATQLQREGYRPPKRRAEFTDHMVSRFLRENCRRGSKPYRLADLCQRSPEEWLLRDLARELGVAEQTLHGWRRRGWLAGRQIAGPQSHWIIWADAGELARLHRLSRMPPSARPYPPDVTTPHPRRAES